MPHDVLSSSTSPAPSLAGAGAPVRRRGRLRPVRIGLCVSALAGITFVGVLSRVREAPASPPVLGEMPAFSMTDQDGRPVTRESLREKTLIVDFFYASCPVSCPRLSAQMAAFQERIAQRSAARGQALPIHLVSITLDPENDAPDVLRRTPRPYAGRKAQVSRLRGGERGWVAARSEDWTPAPCTSVAPGGLQRGSAQCAAAPVSSMYSAICRRRSSPSEANGGI
ncbi:SCO family protein [Sorangium sp. So ce448]|uniref:SCO family protein n=1 Tax=Sorangium sp. So ce448 TaxID=3133314 RepID=UPI003F603376